MHNIRRSWTIEKVWTWKKLSFNVAKARKISKVNDQFWNFRWLNFALKNAWNSTNQNCPVLHFLETFHCTSWNIAWYLTSINNQNRFNLKQRKILKYVKIGKSEKSGTSENGRNLIKLSLCYQNQIQNKLTHVRNGDHHQWSAQVHWSA